MAAHGQTMTWSSHVGRRMQHGSWLQRLRQWFSGRASAAGQVSLSAFSGSWDSQREKFRPMHYDSAFDHVAAQGGRSWSITMHGTML